MRCSLLLNSGENVVETKILERPSLGVHVFIALCWFIGWLLTSWIFKWIDNTMGVETTVFAVLESVSMAIVFYEFLFSKFPFIGVGIAFSKSLGLTFAVSVVFWPLPPQGILLVCLGFTVLCYCTGLVRIARLKKEGYVEKCQYKAEEDNQKE